jgi:hypothetical protein
MMLNVWARSVNGTVGQAFFEARTGSPIKIEIKETKYNEKILGRIVF